MKANKYLCLILGIILPVSGCKKRQPALTSALHEAAKSGDVEQIKSLISEGADVNRRDSNQWTALHEAAHNGKIEAARLLISNGAEVDVKEKDGWTPLFLALPSGNQDLISLFVNNGADVNVKCGQYEETPLQYAARNDFKEITKLLIDSGADVNTKDENNISPLHGAVLRNQKDIVKLLLDNGADVNIKGDWNDGTPLYRANARIADILITNGANVNAKDKYGATPLHRISVWDRKDVAKLLLSHGANPNTVDKECNTPLHKVASSSSKVSKSMVELLIDAGADVNVKNQNGETPLHKEVQGWKENSKDLVELLIAKGADVNAKDNYDSTALHIVAGQARKNVTQMIEILIDKGADVNAKDRWGETPLHNILPEYYRLESPKHYVETAKLLIAKGATVDAKNNITTGISAHDRAQTVKTLIDPKAEPGDLVKPGHIFPLRAKSGGVLERAGHTEAAVDLTKISGLTPGGVICEIMNDDGTMARLPQLMEFSKKFKVKKMIILIIIPFLLLFISSVINLGMFFYSTSGVEQVKFESTLAITNSTQTPVVTTNGHLFYPKHYNPLQKYPVVIIVHGFQVDSSTDLRMVLELTKRGFFALAIDLPGAGR